MTTPDKAKRLIELRKQMALGESVAGYSTQVYDHASEIAQAYLQEREARMLLERAVKEAKACNDMTSEDFEKLRLTKFEKFNVHDLDSIAMACDVALSQVQKMGLT